MQLWIHVNKVHGDLRNYRNIQDDHASNSRPTSDEGETENATKDLLQQKMQISPLPLGLFMFSLNLI
ncbi:hypothetical protein HanPI659440_Chr09g0339001 [Helianthus annuus]|nr:hypothetical protein HanPI659440_Chr09g0339001 [Helianthus annuus]